MKQIQGLIADMPAKDYHAVDALSNSMMRHLKQSPLHLQTYLKDPPEPTKSQIFGSLFHALALEDKREFVVKPAGLDARTTAGKEWVKANQGLTQISEEEANDLQGMAAALYSHPEALKMLKNGKREVSAFAPYETAHGTITRKARFDILLDDTIPDIKTTDDASEESFQKTLANFDYYRQAAWYSDVAKDLGLDKVAWFVFIVVEKKPPYGVMTYWLDAEALSRGREEYRKLADRYAKCKAYNSWPGYSQELIKLSLPNWALRRAA